MTLFPENSIENFSIKWYLISLIKIMAQLGENIM